MAVVNLLLLLWAYLVFGWFRMKRVQRYCVPRDDRVFWDKWEREIRLLKLSPYGSATWNRCVERCGVFERAGLRKTAILDRGVRNMVWAALNPFLDIRLSLLRYKRSFNPCHTGV